MNTAGIKGYICPSCKESFTKLKRETPSTADTTIGTILLFLGIPGILFALAMVLFADSDSIIDRIFGGGVLIFLPAVFTWGGLRRLLPKRNRCPNCSIVLKKKGSFYIAPGGIRGLRLLSEAEQLLEMYASERPKYPMGKIAKFTKSTIPDPETNRSAGAFKTRTDVGKYVCPACGLPFMKALQRVSIGNIIGNIFFGAIALGSGLLVLVGAVIFPLVGLIYRGQTVAKIDIGLLIVGLIAGVIFTICGLYELKDANALKSKLGMCPYCKTQLEKVGDIYTIFTLKVVEKVYHPSG